MSTPLRQIRASEVAEHKDRNSLWIIIHNKVYDVTKFSSEHPGGPEPLLEVAGTIASDKFDDVGHSSDAKEMMQEHLIGELAEEDRPKKPEKPEKSGGGLFSGLFGKKK